jgi:hypothetical protein
LPLDRCLDKLASDSYTCNKTILAVKHQPSRHWADDILVP